MRDFPTKHLARIKRARIDSLLFPDRSEAIRVYYGIEINLEAFALHEEDEHERTINLWHVPLNGLADWRKISGTFGYDTDGIRGTWRVRNEWLAIDLPRVTLRCLGGLDFRVDCELYFDMEGRGDRYRNFDHALSFEAKFTGYRNQRNVFEPETDLSTRENVEKFLAKHLDLSAYQNLQIDDHFIWMDPVGCKSTP